MPMIQTLMIGNLYTVCLINPLNFEKKLQSDDIDNVMRAKFPNP